MVYYATVILTNVGLSAFESQLLAAVMETCFALGTWPFPWTIEIFGRRKIMLWGAAASGLAMLIFIIMIGLPHQTKATQWTAVGCVIAWMFIFGYSWNGAPWVYGPEVSHSRHHLFPHQLTFVALNRLHLSKTDTLEALLKPLVNGPSLSLWSLLEVLLSRM